jgi:hypothetical protein
MNPNFSHSISVLTRTRTLTRSREAIIRRLLLTLLGLLAVSMPVRHGLVVEPVYGLVHEVVYAQGLGSIVGTVTDPSGSVIAGAKVTATETGTGLSRSAVADAQGYYVLASLRPSLYELSVGAPGFRTFTQKDVTLLADQTLTVNARLEVGATSEVISVTSDAVQVDTTTATLKEVIERQRLTELPLNGRNAAELTLLVPGAVRTNSGGVDQGNTKTFPGGVTISTNGSRQNQIAYNLDGGNFVDEYTNINQPFPFPDALQEFSVQTSNYSAEHGQNAGGVVNVVTRSGDNNFHGDLFEFVRNKIFNARNFFADGTKPDKGRDQLKRNQFGGTIGGPVILPSYDGHDRTFFFVGYQGTRFRNLGNTTSTTVPSAADRVKATDPASIKLLTFIPVGDATGQVRFARPDQENFDELVGRVDHSLSSNDHLTFRYAYNRFNKAPVFDPSNILTYADGSTIVNQNYLIHESHTFSSRLINDARFSFARETSNRGPASNVPSVADLGVNIFQPPGKAIQSISVSGAFSLGDNPHAAFVRNNFTWSDDVSLVSGRHNLRFGGVIERSRVDVNNPGFFSYGSFTFASISDFLAGKLSSFQQGNGEFKNNRNTFPGLYIQDDFHASRRLTLNMGLRWEPFLPWREDRGRVELFQPTKAVPGGTKSAQFTNAPPGLSFPGDQGFIENGVKSNFKNFAPRVGFAYDVFGDGKTSLRGGAGIFYDTRVTGIINNRVVDLTPFSPQVGPFNPPGPFRDPYCHNGVHCTGAEIKNPFPLSFPPPSNLPFPTPVQIISFDSGSKYLAPTLYQWNLGVEHQFSGGFLVRVAYVGSHGSHIKESIQLNPAAVGSGNGQPDGSKQTKIDPRRRLNLPFASSFTGGLYGPVWINGQDVNSSYNALQVSVERRLSHGLTVSGSYTYSKSIDDLPVGGGVSEIGADSPSALPWDDPGRHRFDRGPSDFDRTHRFVGSYVWELSPLSGSARPVRSIFGNWALSGLVAVQSGDSLTVLSGKAAGSDLSETGLAQDRGVIQGPAYGAGKCASGAVSAPCVDFLSGTSFVQPQLGTFGNIGKGSLRGPGSFTWDMGLLKNFVFSERWRLQFRAEFFNIFNRTNFNDPTNALNNSKFGTITSAGDPRIGQLALKLFF